MKAANDFLNRGTDAYRVVIVGDILGFDLSRYGDMVSVQSLEDLPGHIFSLRSTLAEDVTVTGIVEEKGSMFEGLCDVLILVAGEAGAIFGRALSIAMNYRTIRDNFTDMQIKALEKGESGKNKILRFDLQNTPNETNESIDEALFGDLKADMAF